MDENGKEVNYLVVPVYLINVPGRSNAQMWLARQRPQFVYDTVAVPAPAAPFRFHFISIASGPAENVFRRPSLFPPRKR